MTQPSDASKKSLRTFQCRDQLWETFEAMARELECSVDYLVNEAMKQYARQRQSGPGLPRTLPPLPSMAGGPSSPLAVTTPAVPMARPAPPPIPTSSSGRLPPPPNRPLPPPPPGGRVPPPIPSAQSTLVRSPLPPPLPTSRSSSVPPHVPAAPLGGLTAIYNGERTTVGKEKFVIGRGRQASDLTIKDPNVSRQHAMVEFQNGVYYMVDLGSTNGVEYNGQRVTRKAIAEGDVFRICDHDIAFTYR